MDFPVPLRVTSSCDDVLNGLSHKLLVLLLTNVRSHCLDHVTQLLRIQRVIHIVVEQVKNELKLLIQFLSGPEDRSSRHKGLECDFTVLVLVYNAEQSLNIWICFEVLVVLDVSFGQIFASLA